MKYIVIFCIIFIVLDCKNPIVPEKKGDVNILEINPASNSTVLISDTLNAKVVYSIYEMSGLLNYYLSLDKLGENGNYSTSLLNGVFTLTLPSDTLDISYPLKNDIVGDSLPSLTYRITLSEGESLLSARLVLAYQITTYNK